MHVVAELRSINAETAVVVRLAADEARVVAVIHFVTREGAIAGVLVDRDPRRLSAFRRAGVLGSGMTASAGPQERDDTGR